MAQKTKDLLFITALFSLTTFIPLLMFVFLAITVILSIIADIRVFKDQTLEAMPRRAYVVAMILFFIGVVMIVLPWVLISSNRAVVKETPTLAWQIWGYIWSFVPTGLMFLSLLLRWKLVANTVSRRAPVQAPTSTSTEPIFTPAIFRPFLAGSIASIVIMCVFVTIWALLEAQVSGSADGGLGALFILFFMLLGYLVIIVVGIIIIALMLKARRDQNPRWFANLTALLCVPGLLALLGSIWKAPALVEWYRKEHTPPVITEYEGSYVGITDPIARDVPWIVAKRPDLHYQISYPAIWRKYVRDDVGTQLSYSEDGETQQITIRDALLFQNRAKLGSFPHPAAEYWPDFSITVYDGTLDQYFHVWRSTVTLEDLKLNNGKTAKTWTAGGHQYVALEAKGLLYVFELSHWFPQHQQILDTFKIVDTQK